MGAMIAASWVTKGMGDIFIGFFDRTAYSLLYAAYAIFQAVCHINLFGGDVEAAMNIYDTFSKNVYNILSIIMVFFFAYQLILMIIDPEGEASKHTSKIIKNTVVSFVFIAICPTLFNWLTYFQVHIVDDNTIPNMVMGTNNVSYMNPGKNLTIIIFMSMYHPEGTDYNTFFNDSTLSINEEDGKAYFNAEEATTSCENWDGATASDETCEEFAAALKDWFGDENVDQTIKPISSRSALRDVLYDDGGMDYHMILSTVTALAVAWFIASYALDMGTRAVKIGFLELIAPIPLMMRIFPQTEKTFNQWFSEFKKTYLDLFMRLLLISFIIEMCTLVPDFVDVIFNSGHNLDNDSSVTQCIAVVVLILGLLKFAKDAPKLVKDLFSNGGLFEGMNLKPGVKNRVKENTLGSKAISAGAGAIGGAIGNGRRNYKDSMAKSQADPNWTGTKSEMRAAKRKARGAFVAGAPRGFFAGGYNGAMNETGSIIKDMGSGGKAGALAGLEAQTKREQGDAWIATTPVGRAFINKGKEFTDAMDNMSGNVGNSKKKGNVLSNASTILGSAQAQVEANLNASPEYKALLESQSEQLKKLYDERSGINREDFVNGPGGVEAYAEAVNDVNAQIQRLQQQQAKERAQAQTDAIKNNENLTRGIRDQIAQVSKLLKDNSSLVDDKLASQIGARMGISDAGSVKDITAALDKMAKGDGTTADLVKVLSAKDTFASAAYATQAKDQAKEISKQNMESDKPAKLADSDKK